MIVPEAARLQYDVWIGLFVFRIPRFEEENIA